MNEWVLFSLLVLGIVTALLIIYAYKMKKNKWKQQTDYKSFFILGICMIPLGIALDMPVFFIIGLVYMAIGLTNKDKWDKKIKMSKQQKKMQTIAVIVGLAVLMVFVVMLFLLG